MAVVTRKVCMKYHFPLQTQFQVPSEKFGPPKRKVEGHVPSSQEPESPFEHPLKEQMKKNVFKIFAT